MLQSIKNFLGFNPEIDSDIESDSESYSNETSFVENNNSQNLEFDIDNESDFSDIPDSDEELDIADIEEELERAINEIEEEENDEDDEKMSELPPTKGDFDPQETFTDYSKVPVLQPRSQQQPQATYEELVSRRLIKFDPAPTPSPSPSSSPKRRTTPKRPKIFKAMPKLPSNVELINFSKPLPLESSYEQWDFLTLYKALYMKMYNDELPKKINGVRLHRNLLKIGETKNYAKEISQLEMKFFKRYNLLKTMEEKIVSLKFIKNGEYLKKITELTDWKNKMLDSQYVEEVRLLKEQVLMNIELSKEDSEKIAEYNLTIENIQRYETYIIGSLVKFGKTQQRKKEESENIIEILEKLNKKYEQDGNIDSQFGIKKIAIKTEKYNMFKDYENPSFFLKSKMIYHLKIFFDVNTAQASLLLENNTFDKIVQYNSFEMNNKLDLMQEELKNLQEIKEYITHMRDRVFLCPHCAYRINMGMNMMFHISHVHKKSSQEPLMVVKPFKGQSVYDNFKSKTENDIYFHMKQNNKINKGKMLDKKVIETMVPYIMKSTEVEENARVMTRPNNDIGIKKPSKGIKRQSSVISTGDRRGGNNFKQSLQMKNEFIMNYLNKTQTDHLNGVIEQASKLRNRTLGYRWVNSIISNYFMEKIFDDIKIDSVIVTINSDFEYNYSNINNIPILITDVSVGGNSLVENSVLKNEEDEMNISRGDLIKLIKKEIFQEKVKEFAEDLAKHISTDVNQNSNLAAFKNLFETFFDKLIDSKRENVDNIFDDLIEDLTDVKDSDDLHYRLTNEREVIKKKNKKKQNNKDFDEVLFYMLLSFLPSNTDVVKNVYNIVEIEEYNRKNRRNKRMEDDDFPYKNSVWRWNSFYTERKVAEDNVNNFQKVSLDEVSSKLFEDEDLKITREIMNTRERVLKAMRFSMYKPADNMSEKNQNKRLNKKERLIKEFIINSAHRKIVDNQDFRIIIATMMLKNFQQIFNLGRFEGKDTFNGEVILRFVKIMNLYIQKDKKYKLVKNKRYNAVKNSILYNRLGNVPVQNRVVSSKKDEDERKDELLNNFMNIDDEALEIEADNPGIKVRGNVDDDEASLFVDMDDSNLYNADDEEDIDIDLPLDEQDHEDVYYHEDDIRGEDDIFDEDLFGDGDNSSEDEFII